jgi:hypothetical protein
MSYLFPQILLSAISGRVQFAISGGVQFAVYEVVAVAVAVASMMLKSMQENLSLTHIYVYRLCRLQSKIDYNQRLITIKD